MQASRSAIYRFIGIGQVPAARSPACLLTRSAHHTLQIARHTLHTVYSQPLIRLPTQLAPTLRILAVKTCRYPWTGGFIRVVNMRLRYDN
jgi:hypothetical protein